MAPENHGMLDWLGGLEPAWTLLGEESLNALMEEPSAENRTLRLADDLSEDELALSACYPQRVDPVARGHQRQ